MKLFESLLPVHGKKAEVHLREDAYMICCPARSGSTLLVHLLRSHPDILSHGEVFGANKITGLSGPLGLRSRDDPKVLEMLEGIRRARPQAFLYSYILNPKRHKVVGFKLKYEELASRKYADICDVIRADTDLKIIFLDRDNLFDRYVSHYVAMNVTGVTLVNANQPTPEVRPVTLRPADIERSFRDESRKRERFRAIFSSHRTIETTYEKLVADTTREMNRIYGFLGLNEHVATTTTKKILDKGSASFIKNYAEIREYFSDTQFAGYFTGDAGSD